MSHTTPNTLQFALTRATRKVYILVTCHQLPNLFVFRYFFIPALKMSFCYVGFPWLFDITYTCPGQTHLGCSFDLLTSKVAYNNFGMLCSWFSYTALLREK